MSVAGKVTGSHREWLAAIYLRQSTLVQVRENFNSTERQYALAGQATSMGWATERVLVIDCDLGVSGRSAQGRAGWGELVGRVCAGEVGAIFGLEISRLARSSADLQRLLELCALTDTLIVDADGTYDLPSFNDRLLVGLTGTMSEAELHILASRLHGAKRAAAQRGALRLPLPIGYLYDEQGQPVIDPPPAVSDPRARDARCAKGSCAAAAAGGRCPRPISGTAPRATAARVHALTTSSLPTAARSPPPASTSSSLLGCSPRSLRRRSRSRSLPLKKSRSVARAATARSSCASNAPV